MDRLLDSPRYGEHMARFWLDAARYGDTHGLHLDNYREIWPYRDWVIKAFNTNKPFDQFVVEQLAGDLLPNPTLDQLIATGYNRCHVSTSEGGSIEEEVYVRNIDDQVDTNGTVFLGLTIGCARCHDHKYDPVRMKEYYQLFAFFNNIDGPAMDGTRPVGPDRARCLREQKAALDQPIRKPPRFARPSPPAVAKAAAAYDGKADAERERVRAAGRLRLDRRRPAPGAQPRAMVPGSSSPVPITRSPAESALRIAAQGLKQRFFDTAVRKLKVGEGDTLFAQVFLDPIDPPKEIMLQWHTADGWGHRAYWGQNVIDWGKDGTAERLRIGDLPASGKWVRLKVEAKK